MRSVEPLSYEQGRKRILEVLDIEVRTTAAMPDNLRARLLANRPSAKEIADGVWNQAARLIDRVLIVFRPSEFGLNHVSR